MNEWLNSLRCERKCTLQVKKAPQLAVSLHQAIFHVRDNEKKGSYQENSKFWGQRSSCEIDFYNNDKSESEFSLNTELRHARFILFVFSGTFHNNISAWLVSCVRKVIFFNLGRMRSFPPRKCLTKPTRTHCQDNNFFCKSTMKD